MWLSKRKLEELERRIADLEDKSRQRETNYLHQMKAALNKVLQSDVHQDK